MYGGMLMINYKSRIEIVIVVVVVIAAGTGTVSRVAVTHRLFHLQIDSGQVCRGV